MKLLTFFASMFAMLTSFFSSDSKDMRLGFANPKALAVVLALSMLAAVNANAALSIDTSAMMIDISTAGTAGIALVLAVAAVAIGVSLVRKLIRA